MMHGAIHIILPFGLSRLQPDLVGKLSAFSQDWLTSSSVGSSSDLLLHPKKDGGGKLKEEDSAYQCHHRLIICVEVAAGRTAAAA